MTDSQRVTWTAFAILAMFVIGGLPIKIFRFPINFKSEVEETSLLSGRKFFYHVVLGIAYKGKS